MTTQLQKAQDLLFGEAGLRASNFKLFPGNARNATAEDVAKEINESIVRIEAGDFDVIDEFVD